MYTIVDDLWNWFIGWFRGATGNKKSSPSPDNEPQNEPEYAVVDGDGRMS
jgi:hypothetical protein